MFAFTMRIGMVRWKIGTRCDLVFLSGLRVDFDGLRQLSFCFRRTGAVVVAGGGICTAFPEFASQFFDACVRAASTAFLPSLPTS